MHVIRTFILFIFFVAGTFSLLCVPHAPALETIRVLYNERPPYLVSNPDGSPSGLTGSPAKYAFERSGLPHTWEIAPTKRQMETLRNSTTKVCIIGWFKNQERETFATFTRALYKDKPMVAVARADNSRIASGMSLTEIFMNKELTLLVKEGFSYGEYIDEKIALLSPKVETTLAENRGMLEMVRWGRADYTLMAPEEAEEIIKTSETVQNFYKLVDIPDIPEGEYRYLLCTKSVSDADIHALNKSIDQYMRADTQ